MGASVARSVGNFVTVPTILMGMMMGRKGGRASGARSNGGCTTDLTINKGDEWDTQQYLEIDGGNSTMEKRRDGKNGERNKNDSSDDLLNHLWEGFVISESLSAKAIIEFLTLGLPGMLQVMFEWYVARSIIYPHHEKLQTDLFSFLVVFLSVSQGVHSRPSLYYVASYLAKKPSLA